MNQPGAPVPSVAAVIERYLAEVTGRLPGSPRTHSGIVAELRAGLLDATGAYQSAGQSPAGAVQAAIREFGDPARVAGSFRAEIATRLARRVAVAVLVTGPLVGLLWIVTAVASHLVGRLPWAGLPAGLRVGLILVAVAATVTAGGALLGIAATGRLTRWLPGAPRRAPTAAAIAGFGAVGADALGLALLAAELATMSGTVSPVPATAAAAASVVRLTLARRAACHCLAMRAALT